MEELETEFGLKQIIKCATKLSANRETTIDLILTNISNIYEAGCLLGTFSDHHPTYLVKKRVKPNIEMTEFRKRKMSRFNSEEFMDTWRDLDWSVLELLDDVDEMWDMIYKGLLHELDAKYTYTFIKIRKDRPKWFTYSLMDVARERDNLMKRYKDRDNLMKRYKDFRDDVILVGSAVRALPFIIIDIGLRK